ncbi:lysophospholipid acyltransferase family protein [uncultured Sphaerotilus sp.]|uniref:lysophospholipid acyltransferase family protein n=1 Tax=uncultured Sphaerotilus sp. TaxID=474984 RepID=UPI0030CA2F5B
MLIYLRSAVFLLWLIVTVIPWSLVAVLASAFTRGAPLYWLCAGWLKVAILGAKWICGVHWRVQGMEHVPTAADGTASVILVPKHQSTWETFAFPALMPHPLAYVFKRELLYIPFFGWAIGRLDMVHINRGRGSDAWRKVVEQGTRIMAQGTWMIMFPEGTRTPRGSQGEYKTGASRLAVTTKTPLVPIAVTSARCWPRKSFLLRPGTIDISIGRPINPQGRRPDDLMREIEAWIESEMRRLDPEAYTTTPQG